MDSTDVFIKRAVELACTNTREKKGKPFGAVIVKDGRIIAEGVNDVLETHDPTAHAEIQAIREASRVLRQSDLSDCELYASGEPCPMCLSAVYWAKFKAVYYAYTEEEASRIGMSTKFVYDQLALAPEKRVVQLVRVEPDCPDHPYTIWKESQA
ncbi:MULTISPECIES: nucleoside deaminase [Paenibacillus]|uniref:nucleoside deaminase n=1 Tax=Paenibacillus TaxID=44249 RepID=UPI001C308450|nr:nucleoside deaminase [Paenibacillus sp. GbtcB18]